MGHIIWKPSEVKAVKHHLVDVLAELHPSVLQGNATKVNGSVEYLSLAEDKAGLAPERKRSLKSVSMAQVLGSTWLEDIRKLYRARSVKSYVMPAKTQSLFVQPGKPAAEPAAEKKPVYNGSSDPILNAIASLERRMLALELKYAQR